MRIVKRLAAFLGGAALAVTASLAVATPAAADYCSDRTPNGRFGVFSHTYCYGTMNTYGIYGSGQYKPVIRVTSVMNDTNIIWNVCKYNNFTGCRELLPGQRISSVYALGWTQVGAISHS